MSEAWLTAQDVSGILKMHIDDVYRLMASGEIPARKFGRRWRVPPGELEKLGGVAPPPRESRPKRTVVEPPLESQPRPRRSRTDKPAEVAMPSLKSILGR